MAGTGQETGQDFTTEAQQILLLAHRFDIAAQFTAAERARAGEVARPTRGSGKHLGMQRRALCLRCWPARRNSFTGGISRPIRSAVPL